MSGAADGSRAGFETARLKLARLRLDGEDARQSAMRQLARVSAQALEVERVGVWLFEDAGQRARNLGQYRRSSDVVTSGEALETGAHPGYLAALNERRVLAVADCRNHAVARELAGSAFALIGTTARLDAPIIRAGIVAGVVCYEHVGDARIWSQKDRDFAASTADMAALFLEQADRLEIEVALRERRENKLAEDKMAALGRLAAFGRPRHQQRLQPDRDDRVPGRGARGRGAAAARRLHPARGRVGRKADRAARPLRRGGLRGPCARVDLAGLLDRLRPVLGDLTSGKRLEIAVLSEAPIIVANAAQIEQVLLNLCVNAAEAIPSGADGVIRIEIRDPRPGEEVDPTSVVLSVEDNGRGMDAETLSHVFEPYFSRKASGHGIGLSVVYGIVKRCRGSISVRSEPGAGATFTIALPRAPAPEPLR